MASTRKRNRKPSHPGAVFKIDVLEPLGLNITEAAKAMAVSRKHLSAFVNERIPCSKDLAKRLALSTNTSVASWLTMQTELDVWEAEHNPSDDYSEVKSLAGLAV